MELIGWDTPMPAGRGRGIAVGIKSSATTGLSYSTVRLLIDGSALVYAGTSDMGQGARTIFAQIAATELGTPLEDVSVSWATRRWCRTTSRPRPAVRPSSWATPSCAACRDIQAQVRSMAARPESVPESQIVVDRGVVSLPDGDVPIIDIVKAGLGKLGGELIGNGDVPQGGRTRPPARWQPGLLRVQLHRRGGLGGRRDRPHHHPQARHRRGHGQVAEPPAGGRPGRGRGHHGPGPHADGAHHPRRVGVHPQPRGHRLSHPHVHGPAAGDGERGRRERGRPRTLRRQGRQRGRPALGPVGRRLGCR